MQLFAVFVLQLQKLLFYFSVTIIADSIDNAWD